MKKVLFFIFLYLVSLYATPIVTESFKDRIRVLYLSGKTPHQNYGTIEFLERITNLRFIYQRNSNPKLSGDEESSQICDGILWDNSSFPLHLERRNDDLRGYLKRKNFDFIVLENKKFMPDIEEEILRYVKEGGFIVYLGNDLIEDGILKDICPFIKKEGKISRNEGIKIKENYLFNGFPLKEMLEGLSFQPISFKENVEIIAETEKTKYGIIGIMKYGEGKILGFSLPNLIPVIHNYGDKNKLDTDFLWKEFWERIDRILKKEDKCQITATLDKNEIIPLEEFTIFVERYKDEFEKKKINLCIEIVDSRGKIYIEKKLKDYKGEKIKIPLNFPYNAHTGKYLIKIRILDSKETIFSSFYLPIFVKGLVDSKIATDKYGYKIDEDINFKVNINSKIKKRLKVEISVSTPFDEICFYDEREIFVNEGNNELNFKWKMPDYGIDGWAFKANLFVKDFDDKEFSYDNLWFWKYEVWNMREKFLISNYWSAQHYKISSFMPLYALYMKGIGYNAGHEWQEPYYSNFNMRAWYQFSATMMEKYTNDFKTKDFSHLKEMVKNEYERKFKTSAYVIYDFGEETGFYYHWSNNPFGRKWLKDEDIPEGANRFFRIYLKEKYKTIENLNYNWDTNYKDFEEIKLSVKYGYPSGWLFLPPPKEIPENITPIIDTHGFFFWYTENVAKIITESLREYNPTADLGMSFSLTFNLCSPIPMTMIHPFYHSSVLIPWHSKAIKYSKNSSTPIFSFHWGFDPDYRVWAQFWNQSLASLSTFISNWGDQFNEDLTHSRATIYLKKLMKKVRKKEKLFMECYPVENFDIGFYHPFCDWKQVHSRPSFFLKSQGPESEVMGQLGYKSTGTGWLGGPEFQIFNLLNSTGYIVKYLDDDEIDINKCKVIFVCYVECLSEKVGEKLKKFVNDGGILITFPITGIFNEYGKPYKEYPGAGLSEVLGIKLDKEIIGKRSIITPKSKENLKFKFTQRPGSETNYLWTFGHQKLLSKKDTAEILFNHYDGNPAITVNSYGKGKSIHFNMFTFDHFSQYEISHFNNESLRQILYNIIKNFANIEPFFKIENPLYYGEGINEWAIYQYQIKDSQIRILSIYSDRTNPTITGEVILNEKMYVFDILNDCELYLKERITVPSVETIEPFSFIKSESKGVFSGFSFPVKLNPGDIGIFAFVPYKVKEIKVDVIKNNVNCGEDIEFDIELVDTNNKKVETPHPVHLEFYNQYGEPMPLLRRKVLIKGKTKIKIPTLISYNGKFRCFIKEIISNKEKEVKFFINGDKKIEIVNNFYPSSKIGKIEISDEEFINLIKALTQIYLSEKIMDRSDLSYYIFEKDISRHRITKLLNNVNWKEKVHLLKKYISEGNLVILTGEDMGIDWQENISTDPLSINSFDESCDFGVAQKINFMKDARIISALEELTNIKNLKDKIEKEKRLVIKIGKGILILDKTSFDNICSLNSEFEIEYRKWITEIKKIIRRRYESSSGFNGL